MRSRQCLCVLPDAGTVQEIHAESHQTQAQNALRCSPIDVVSIRGGIVVAQQEVHGVEYPDGGRASTTVVELVAQITQIIAEGDGDQRMYNVETCKEKGKRKASA